MFSNKITRTFGKKVRIGRLGLPLWAIGLAVMGMAAVAGQAVGPVLAGSVTGSAGLTVAQTVVLKPATPPTDLGADTVTLWTGNDVTTIVSDDFAAVMNDEGTEFTVAMETQVGQTTGFGIYLDNLSGKNANFILELKAPAGIDIDANDDATGDASGAFARLDATHWLGVLTAGVTNGTVDIKVVVEPKDDAAPSFYTIKGRIIQVSG